MGGAILAGITRPGVMVDGIVVTARTAAAAARLDPGIESASREADPEANRAAVRGARLVVVAVKPVGVPELLAEIADALEPDAVIISVAAGVTTATMEALVPGVVLRAMPNTPALVGRGMTGLAAGSRARSEHVELARGLFETVGEVLVVDEGRIDALTAISGSGPAYVFHAIEQWMRAARGLGFSDEEAGLLVGQTFRGASELLAASDADAAELRRRVTSPGGTTERAVAVLDDARLDEVYGRAAAAALARARELAAGS